MIESDRKKRTRWIALAVLATALAAVAGSAVYERLRPRGAASGGSGQSAAQAPEIPQPAEARIAEAPPFPVVRAHETALRPGDKITIEFSGIRAPAKQDWVSLYRVGAAASSYGEWRYLEARGSGVLVFTAPQQEGDYELRLFLDWPKGGYNAVATSPSIRVAAASASGAEGSADFPPFLHIGKATFAPGETIRVYFKASPGFAANAWIGILPSSIPHGSEAVNDQHDTTYQYLNKRATGELAFQAPSAPGSYDLRMHDTDDGGKEVAHATFKVVSAAVDLGGAWRCDDGSEVRIRQIDDAIWWYSEMPSDRGAAGRSAGHGRVVRNRIDLDWAELPADEPSELPAEAPPVTRPLASGKLVLDAASAGDLVVVEKPEGCGISRCRR